MTSMENGEDGMASEERILQAARFLHEAHRERAAYQPILDDFAPRDINEAYDIQEAFHELLKPERGAIVGYKVALTTTVMQQMVGFGADRGDERRVPGWRRRGSAPRAR